MQATRVVRWGSSLAVRLPKKVVEEPGLRAGDALGIVAATRHRIEVAKDDRHERALAADRHPPMGAAG